MKEADSHKAEATQFHLREYEALHKEMRSSSRELFTLELYAVIGSGIVWTWLATAKLEHQPPRILWWIPLLFSFLGILRTRALFSSIGRTSEYLQLMEKAFCKEGVLSGWETFIHKPENQKQYIRWTTWLFWIIFLIATILIPFIAP
jgi:hypothetical protein